MGKKQKKIVQNQVFRKRDEEVDAFSPFKDIVIREASEKENQKKKHNPDNRGRKGGSDKKPGEIIQGYNPNASFADILSSYEKTGNPYRLPKKNASNGGKTPAKEEKMDFGSILDMWEGGGKKKSTSDSRQKSPTILQRALLRSSHSMRMFQLRSSRRRRKLQNPSLGSRTR